MKKNVKSTTSFFRLLIEHRDYEPSPSHILKRMLIPLCEHLAEIAEKGTKNDAWDVIKGFTRECERGKRRAARG